MLDLIKTKIYSSLFSDNFCLSEKATQQMQLSGLKGSLRALFLSYLVETQSKTLVFLTSDLDSAERMRDDLELCLNKDQVAFFPTDEREPYDEREHHASLQRLRLETLYQLIENKEGVVVSTLQGLMKRVPSPEAFLDRQFDLVINRQQAHHHLLKQLVDAGYTHVDIVENVGHFAVRGGIIDIFPWSSDDPVRIEFFGDRIESIRSFNVISQRSIEEIKEIEILPNPQREEQTSSLFDYLTEDTIFILEDFDLLEEKGMEYEQLIHSRYHTLIGENIYPQKPEVVYLHWASITEYLRSKIQIHIGLFQAKKQLRYEFKSITPPTFAGHLNRFFSYIKKSKSDQVITVIQCDSKSQAERLFDILDEEKLGDVVNIMVGAFHQGFVISEIPLQILTDHEIFDRFKKRRAYKRFKNGEYLRSLRSLNLNDYVVHIEYGIGQYQGLHTIDSGDTKRECIKIAYAQGDVLFVSVDRLSHVQKYASEDETIPKLTRLGSGEWERLKKRTRESIDKIAIDLIKIQAARKAENGISFSADSHWQKELEASFPYEETEDQVRSIREVKKDLEQKIPMDRLLCGDVGYGKTEVALRAAFKVVMDGKQVIILVPTTILAYQHFQTFKERMSEFPVHIEMLSRFRTAAQQRQVIKKLASGQIDVVIGTHRLLSEDVQLKNLGLLIIDEEQRFGVRHKEKLKNLRLTVDVLTLTATPIPRTLHLSMMGARDLSNIETPPRNRLPVITEIHEWDDDLIAQAINREIDRKGQVYFVHNRIKTIGAIKKVLSEIVPHARIVIAHGQLAERELEKIMMDFIHKEYDVLLSTMIIENGLDIPNVNTIIIDHADKFGLAQMYQLRGRVGRSNIQAYAYLLVPHVSRLTDLAQKRLRAIQDFTDLGSGFKVALRDMEIRGIGNILGKEQSGNVQAVGFDLYCKLIEESVREYKSRLEGTETNQAVERYTDAKLDVNFDLMIPKDYITSDTERVEVYHRLVNFSDETELQEIKNEIKDRFGPVPDSVNRIISAVEIKILAGRIYAAGIKLSDKQVILKFSDVSNNPVFHQNILPKILKYDQSKLRFSGDQINPIVQLKLEDGSITEQLDQTRNILHQFV